MNQDTTCYGGRPLPRRHCVRWGPSSPTERGTAVGKGAQQPPTFRPVSIVKPFLASSHGGSGPLTNTWLLGPTRIHIPNGISISCAVFAGLTIVTDRQTDRPPYSVDNSMAASAYVVLRCSLLTVKAKFHYAIWFEAGSKLVADLQRAEIWPII